VNNVNRVLNVKVCITKFPESEQGLRGTRECGADSDNSFSVSAAEAGEELTASELICFAAFRPPH
jgi:hypothetical protein